jgi:hypothetical protein
MTITGIIMAVENNTLTVDTTTFTITTETVVTSNGTAIPVTQITVKNKVTVHADKMNDTLLAKQIILLDNTKEPVDSATKLPTSNKRTVTGLPETTELTTPPTADTEIAPTVKAGFIPEDPNPQTSIQP